MDIIPLHIEYLLTRHDCVIVPGIGAFIATETEAFIDLENGIICPRRREISFNGSVVTDDGLLSHSIARHEGIAYEDARRKVALLAERMTADLNNEGEVSLGMVGRLVKNSEGLLIFQPRISSMHTDILPEIKLSKKAPEPFKTLGVTDIKNEGKKEKEHDGMRTIYVRSDRYVFTISKRAAHAAAMLITILTVGLSLLIPINHDNEQKASVISIEKFFHHKVNANFLKSSDNKGVSNIFENDSIDLTNPASEL